MAQKKIGVFNSPCWRQLSVFGLLAGSAFSLAAGQTVSPARTDSFTLQKEATNEGMTSGNLAASERALRSDLSAHPDSAAAIYQLALVLQQENKPKESLEFYTRAAKIRQPDAQQLRSVALDYVLLSDYADAIHWLEVALSFDPKNVDVLYSLARCYYTQNHYQQAESMFLRVLQIDPNHLKAEENLGLTYDAENEPDKAEAALGTAAAWAVNQSPDQWPFLDYGSFLLDRDRAAEATPWLQRAVAIAPSCAPCHEKLGRALVQEAKTQEGVKELESAAQLDPGNPGIHFELGRAYRQGGALDKARTEFATSEKLRSERDKN